MRWKGRTNEVVRDGRMRGRDGGGEVGREVGRNMRGWTEKESKEEDGEGVTKASVAHYGSSSSVAKIDSYNRVFIILHYKKKKSLVTGTGASINMVPERKKNE